ncbi:hypothetical protein DRN74_05860 [Candidatus Micrarchaeota archaeon]|nr:MAG: hypothetical protein DRN74_05860 [Candidatus Micrarchaeota archaeon]
MASAKVVGLAIAGASGVPYANNDKEIRAHGTLIKGKVDSTINNNAFFGNKNNGTDFDDIRRKFSGSHPKRRGVSNVAQLDETYTCLSNRGNHLRNRKRTLCLFLW